MINILISFLAGVILGILIEWIFWIKRCNDHGLFDVDGNLIGFDNQENQNKEEGK